MKDIKAIKLITISLCFVYYILITSCNIFTRHEALNISLIKSIVQPPKVDERGLIYGDDQVLVILEIQNLSDRNYYLQFDHWMEISNESSESYIQIGCNEKYSKYNLEMGYITSPVVYVRKHSIDTFTLRSINKGLIDYTNNCIENYTENELQKKFSGNLRFTYDTNRNFGEIIRNNEIYFPIKNISKVIN